MKTEHKQPEQLYLPQEYADMLRGMHISAQDVATLNKLVRRAYIPARPCAYTLATVLGVDMVGLTLLTKAMMNNPSKELGVLAMSVAVAQMVAACAIGSYMQHAEKKLKNTVQRIVKENQK